ncbi:hypothetical protein C0991_005933 [Blastosporella zonata]|nr:hypothetical protein C0991_005933 [Blastosporella zonata]
MPVTIAVIGCGQRGKNYSRYAKLRPDACKIVAIAEPRPKTQAAFAAEYAIDPTLVFNDWRTLLTASTETIATVGTRLADAVIIAVQDHLHLEVTLAFAEQGYHILCEKPMATTPEDCIRMEDAVKKGAQIFGMGHVLRYSPYSKDLSKILHSGALGELVNVVHVEPVGYYHFAHSFVRGNWNNEATSSFSLLTKSCHDIDLLCHWFAPQAPKRVSSFGSLQHFRKSAKPANAGSATRCTDCAAEKGCPYSAKKIYLEPVSKGITSWPASIIVDGVPDIENVTHALTSGPYGLCVYESANDVVDHQVVNLEFANGATASFTMVAYTSLICDRQSRLHFTHGEIVGNMESFVVTDFRTGVKTTHLPKKELGGGHGGGDLGLIGTFVEAVRTGNQGLLGTDVTEVLKSHLTVFAAEKSRREGRVVDCEEYERELREKMAGKAVAQEWLGLANMAEEQLLQLGGGRVIAFEQGGDISSSTVLLFFHGAFGVGDASDSSPVLLDKGVRFLTPTLPGWGKSSPIPGTTPYHIGLAEDISALLQHLFPSSTELTLYIAGGSFGSVPAQMLYGASFDIFPQGRKVKGCLLLAPLSPFRHHKEYTKTMGLANYIGVGPPSQWVPFRLVQRLAVGVIKRDMSTQTRAEVFMRGQLFGKMGAVERGAFERWRARKGRSEEEVVRKMARNVVRSVGTTWAGFMQLSDVAHSDWGFRPDALDADHAKTMLIVVSRDDEMAPPAMGEWLAGAYANASLEVIEGGHTASMYELDEILATDPRATFPWLRHQRPILSGEG